MVEICVVDGFSRCDCCGRCDTDYSNWWRADEDERRVELHIENSGRSQHHAEALVDCLQSFLDDGTLRIIASMVAE